MKFDFQPIRKKPDVEGRPNVKHIICESKEESFVLTTGSPFQEEEE